MKKVVIVGCGWLGQQLATTLAGAGYLIYGSRRTVKALASLPPEVKPVLLDLAVTPFDESLLSQLHQSTVICAISPGRSGADNQYLLSLTRLSQLMLQAGSKFCIHISSTGVYQGLNGKVNEQSALNLENERVALLYQGEQLLRQSTDCLTLRLAGLIGHKRHPAFFTTGKTLGGATGPVNIIHAADVCTAVQQLLPIQVPDTLNLCCLQTVTKQDFYQAACNAKQLPPPVYTSQTVLAHQVDGSRICQRYGFQYRFQNALQAINYCD